MTEQPREARDGTPEWEWRPPTEKELERIEHTLAAAGKSNAEDN